MNQTQDSYRGALIGAAVGDALGATVDRLTRSEVKEKYGVHREIVGGGRLNLDPGEAGDDTGLAVAVARSLAEQGDYDLKDIALQMTEYIKDESTGSGLGPTTSAVLPNLKPKGKDIFAAAAKYHQQNPDAGSGCIARVAPVGMLRRVLFKELVAETIEVCRLTHYDQRSVDACIAFNFGVSYLTSGKDPSKLLFKTWRFLADQRESKEYRELFGEESLPAEQDMVKALKAVNTISYDDLRANGRAIETTQAAYWLTLNAIDFEEGLVRAVNLGGDAATLGAVVGTLLGARFGEQAIPERWLGSLRNSEELESVADKLCKLGEPRK